MNAPRTTHAPDPAEQGRLILEMYRELQDVKKETREIRHMLERGESWRNYIWRAITNFVGFVKADQSGSNPGESSRGNHHND